MLYSSINKMNSDEMTGILLDIPKQPLQLKRQFSYYKEKNEKEKMLIKIEELEKMVKYWRTEASNSKKKYETLVKSTI